MTEADWQPLRDLEFDERACLEVAHIVGIFNYLTRLADGSRSLSTFVRSVLGVSLPWLDDRGRVRHPDRTGVPGTIVIDRRS
jgi:hypothetical protein